MGFEKVADKFLKFATKVIQYCQGLNKNPIEKHLAMQLVRSSTSCGANYEETRGAESRADFIHKIQIVLKEARESLYLIKLLKELNVGESEKISELYARADELVRIMTKSVLTAKKNKKIVDSR